MASNNIKDLITDLRYHLAILFPVLGFTIRTYTLSNWLSKQWLFGIKGDSWKALELPFSSNKAPQGKSRDSSSTTDLNTAGLVNVFTSLATAKMNRLDK